MDFIKNKATGVIYDASGVGYPYTYAGKTGVIKNKEVPKGWCPMFNPDGVVETGIDTVWADYMYDLSNIFEAVDSGTEPPAVIDCTVPPVVSIESDATYKVFNGDGSTTFKFIITGSGTTRYEFSTKRSGPSNSNGLDGSGNPVHWVEVTKDGAGFFNVIVPSSGIVEPVWTRKIGCSANGTWGQWISYNPDGSDPLLSGGTGGGGGGGGSTGTGNAVVTDFPLGITTWGFFFGRSEPLSDILRHKTHYAEQSAMSDNMFKGQRPFFAVDTPPTTVPVGIWSSVANEHIIQNRFSNTDWQATTSDMDWCIEYLIRAGLQYFKFEYYANGYDGAIMRTMFEQNPNKRGVKAAYVVGQFGGDRDSYPDPNNDYTKNLKHFAWALRQPWYQQIDGKPLVFHFKNQGGTFAPPSTIPQAMQEMAIDLNRLRAEYGGDMHEVHCESDFNASYDVPNYYGMDSRTWYYCTNSEANGSHILDTTNADAYNGTIGIISYLNALESAVGVQKYVCPSFNIAMDGRARAMYPGDKYQHGTPDDGYGINYNPNIVNGFYYPATQSDIQSVINKAKTLRSVYPNRVKTAVFATFDENSEGGISCLIPKKRANGTIDDSVVMWFKQELNPNYVI